MLFLRATDDTFVTPDLVLDLWLPAGRNFYYNLGRFRLLYQEILQKIEGARLLGPFNGAPEIPPSGAPVNIIMQRRHSKPHPEPSLKFCASIAAQILRLGSGWPFPFLHFIHMGTTFAVILFQEVSLRAHFQAHVSPPAVQGIFAEALLVSRRDPAHIYQ